MASNRANDRFKQPGDFGNREAGLGMDSSISRLNGINKRMLTTAEAAQICRLSHETIIQCLSNGKLRGISAGRAEYPCIPRKELLRFMKLCGYR